MGKSVALEVKAVASTNKHLADTNKTGSWHVTGDLVAVPANSVTLSGKPLLHKATALFTYIGGSNPSPGGPVPLPPILSPPLVLEGSSKALKVSGQSVVLEGDKAEDAFANKLEVAKTSDQLKSD